MAFCVLSVYLSRLSDRIAFGGLKATDMEASVNSESRFDSKAAV